MDYKHLYLILLCLFLRSTLPAQCSNAGTIDQSFSTCSMLDPDGDGDIVAQNQFFSGCSDELNEFESILNPASDSDCQVPWTAIGTTEADDDLWKGKGGKATDIISDENGGNNFAYFSIVDPDGVCDSGDELMAFRIRLASDFSGNYGFNFFISNDGLIGENDSDGIICNNKSINPGFEYEIQLTTNGNNKGISIYDIDGQAGDDNCSGQTPCISYPLNSHAQKAKACGSISACRSALPAGDPVFLSFYILLDDIGANAYQYDLLSVVPTTSTSGNRGTGVCSSQIADIGGVSSEESISDDCTSCASPKYDGCSNSLSKLSCALICAAEKNTLSQSLPVDLVEFKGDVGKGMNQLSWTTANESNTEWFVIERAESAMGQWQELDRKMARGYSTQAVDYLFIDDQPFPSTYYRLQIIDFDGSIEYSPIISLIQQYFAFSIEKLFPNPVIDQIHLAVESPKDRSAVIHFTDVKGRLVKEEQVGIQKGNNQFTFDISELPTGIYSLQLISEYQQLISRVVKL